MVVKEDLNFSEAGVTLSSERDMVVEKSIQFALDDLESIICEFPKWQPTTDIQYLRRWWGFMRIFHLCRKMWGEDPVRGESASCTMEEAVLKSSLEIQFLYLTFRQDHNDRAMFHQKWDHLDLEAFNFLYVIQAAIKAPSEILSDVLKQNRASPHLGMEEILRMIESLLPFSPQLQVKFDTFNLVNSISKTLGFWKNLVLFAASQGLVEHRQVMQDLLIHIQDSVVYLALATVGADLLDKLLSRKFQRNEYMRSIDLFESHMNEYQRNFYLLKSQMNEYMRSIDLFESHLREMYLGVLQEVSAFSQSSMHPTLGSHSTLLWVDFVDSLLYLLLNLLFHGNDSHWYSFHNQIHEVFEGLEFLKTTLSEHHDDVGEQYEKKRHLLGTLICEAGIIICSLFIQKGDDGDMVERLEALFSEFMEKFKLIKGAEEEAPRYSLPSTSNFPETNLPGLIDSILEKSMSLNPSEADSTVASVKDKFQSVLDDLACLRTFLVDVTRTCNQNGKLKALLGRVAIVAHEIEFVLDSLLVGDDLESFTGMLDTLAEEVEVIKIEALESSHRIGKVLQIKDDTKTRNNRPNKVPEFTEQVVGMDDEEQKIIDKLTRGTKQLDIVSIVGMAGLGKTTLAKKVYRNLSIINHFQVRSWCTVSQEYHKSSLLLDVLRGIDGQSGDKSSEMNEHDLAQKLYQCLKRKRYLIILDDVWDVKAWGDLKNSFPNDTTGSRILLTSRHENVALQIKLYSEPHCLRWLNHEESWELFQMKICFTADCSPELLARGKAIAKRCKGLPLTILVIAGLLSTMEPRTWEEIEKSLNKGINQCKDTIDLSYHCLPDHLKPCFLYFGRYKEDQQIHVMEMLWLWIAEGFVKRRETECMEDIAESYMMELIHRNLVMIARKGSGGRVKTCILHDLLHEFCLERAKEEHFLHRLQSHEISNLIDPCTLYRLHIYNPNMKGVVESRLLYPRLHSLSAVTGFRIRVLEAQPWYGVLYGFCHSKLLGVLDLRETCQFTSFPGVVLLLGCLRYLSLLGKGRWEIPLFIDNLSFLETFLVFGCDAVVLPHSLWNMNRLRHLQGALGWELPHENPTHPPSLGNLQTLSCVKFYSWKTMMEVIPKFPHIRKLKCDVYSEEDGSACGEDLKIVVALDSLSRLETLSIEYSLLSKIPDLHFQFPRNIKKLTLYSLYLPWSRISSVNRLPNLEVLKLHVSAFTGSHWNMEEEEEDETFPNLRFLELRFMDLARWTGSDTNFPRLEKLVLDNCYNLVELPSSCFAQSSTLQTIEVTECKKIEDSIKEIQELKMHYGNEDLKICHRSSDMMPFSVME